MPETIDQLLGYLSWRDSRAALIWFVREKNFRSVMETAITEAKEHPAYLREEKAPDGEGRLIFGLPDDPQSEVTVAVIGFATRGGA